MHHALDRIGQGNIKSKITDAGYNAVKFFSQMLCHIFCLITVLTVPFHHNGLQFRIAGTLRSLSGKGTIPLFNGFCGTSCTPCRKNPMNGKVGIPANWRGKMCVVLQCKPKMPNRFRCIGCLCHGTQHHNVHHWISRTALCLLQNFCQVPRLYCRKVWNLQSHSQ